MSDTDSDYVGSAVTAIDYIEVWDYDEYLDEYGELPEGGIEDGGC